MKKVIDVNEYNDFIKNFSSINEGYYVYKFLDNSKRVLYIGKTKNIQKRLNTHFLRGHLKRECYEKVNEIVFTKLPTIADMDIVEHILIKTEKPLYNTKMNKDSVKIDYNLNLKWYRMSTKMDFYTDYTSPYPFFEEAACGVEVFYQFFRELKEGKTIWYVPKINDVYGFHSKKEILEFELCENTVKEYRYTLEDDGIYINESTFSFDKFMKFTNRCDVTGFRSLNTMYTVNEKDKFLVYFFLKNTINTLNIGEINHEFTI